MKRSALITAVSVSVAASMLAAGASGQPEAQAQPQAQPQLEAGRGLRPERGLLTGHRALSRIDPQQLMNTNILAQGLSRPMAFAGTGLRQDEIQRHLLTDRPTRFKPVGSTSVVFEMRLDGPVNGAFKPRSRQRSGGAASEVAAYRIARLLGMDNVPPAVTRRIRREDIQARLHPDFADAWDEIVDWTVWNDDGTCTGAAIYWVPQMRSLGLERAGRMTRWTRRLRQGGEIDANDVPLHADLSRLVVFDYLIGNWDRWSGANAQGLPDASRLIIRDHDSAFSVPLPAEIHRRVFDHLKRTEKFSRTFVQRLLRMNEEALRAELGRDPGARGAHGELSLDDRQIAAVMDRRQAVISYIVALIDAHGRDRVLSLP
ncbi:MAG: hypothetical protein DRJ42_03575 [Deltaproteobacteria bacterium]|nr:MAG: hypothetical protein DRJ42_03575 [Deltaproteobacteria bacterium]